MRLPGRLTPLFTFALRSVARFGLPHAAAWLVFLCLNHMKSAHRGAQPRTVLILPKAGFTEDVMAALADADDVRRWCADAGRPTRFKPSRPSPTDAVRDGSAKLGHPVQNVTREHGLTPLPR